MINSRHIESEAGKYYFMMNQRNNQLLQEQEAWKRTLEIFKQENSLLKYRLSEMVDKSEGDHFLQTAEYFQNEFLKKDEWLQRLSHNLQSLQEELFVGNAIKGTVLQDELRNQMAKFEEEYIQLSDDFNQKVIKSIR